MQDYDVVIVGAGHGGAQAAIALRQAKFAGSILLIGDEPELPYERPPLSKEYLAGQKPFERLLIRPAAFWSERRVQLRLGFPVIEVDAAARRVVTAARETVGYGRLIWATGGRPRRLTCEGGDLAGVHAVRTRADVDRMIGELAQATRAVVIGGGYIGLEAAAVLSKLGKAVVVVEALDRVLARVAGEPLSRFYEQEHRSHGVDVRLSTSVDGIVGEEGRATGVRLSGGDVLPADLVVVGIGIAPATEALIAAGAEGGNGVHVDARCRTSLPGVYAIGDCASHPNPFAGGERIRLESVQNANDQAAVIAREIVGAGSDYHAVPWFWSNQYDLKLQTVGLSAGHDTALVRGDPAARSFSIVYLKDGAVVALDCVNTVKDYVQGRRLVEAGAIVDPVQLTKPATALKDIQNLLPLG